VACASDLPAFDDVAERQRHDGAAPGRIAIAGFDDFELARTCRPRLSAVAVDCVDAGRTAGELRLHSIGTARSGQHAPAETALVPSRIAHRENHRAGAMRCGAERPDASPT